MVSLPEIWGFYVIKMKTTGLEIPHISTIASCRFSKLSDHVNRFSSSTLAISTMGDLVNDICKLNSATCFPKSEGEIVYFF